MYYKHSHSCGCFILLLLLVLISGKFDCAEQNICKVQMSVHVCARSCVCAHVYLNGPEGIRVFKLSFGDQAMFY